jgi:uncharacterized repeat protein (TIGR01451 family)/CSLREA domain-containing protein
MNKRVLTLSLLFVWLFSTQAAVPGSSAKLTEDILVNSTADVVADDGLCTLREAISAANNDAPSGASEGECPAGDSGIDTIIVPAGVYTLSLAGVGEDDNATGDLDIKASMSIQGAGADKTYIQAGATAIFGIDRVFHLSRDNIEVTFQGLTIRYGRLTGDYALGAGIYINADSLVNIDSCAINSNTNATLNGNGGGIANLNDKSLNIINSGVYGNWANGSIGTLGGGIFHHSIDPQSALNIANSTIHRNYADFGGGIHSYYGKANLTHVTITGNYADFDMDGYGDGGGLVGNDQVTIKNSLIAGNTANVGNNPDIKNAIQSQDYNLIGIVADGSSFSPAAHDLWGNASNPLDPLIGNFAYTLASHQLWQHSLVLDQIPTASCTYLSSGTNPLFSSGEIVPQDQRGSPRPNNGICDIGAREYYTLTISSTVDTFQDDGLCTLREAVSTANSGAPSGDSSGECQLPPDALDIPTGTYTLALAGAQEDDNLTGDLDMLVDLTLNGSGAEKTIIQSGINSESAIDRVLHVHQSAMINALTIAHGSTQEGFSESGGGIYQSGGRILAIKDSVVRDNDAERSGGGIMSSADHTYIRDSAILRNHSSNHDGGGIFLFGAYHTIANSTISSNQAAHDGGGVYLKGTELYLTHVTIAENSADSDEDGSGDGGGLYAEHDLNMKNTLIAGNQDKSGEKPDLAGDVPLASMDYNLIGDLGTQTFTPQSHDILGSSGSPIDPRLESLTGVIPYYLPTLDSPVIDYIPATSCTYVTHNQNPFFSNADPVEHDQRGVIRPADSDMDGTAACEIGAIEYNEPILSFTKGVDNPNPAYTDTATFTLTIQNSGPGDATQTVISDTLPSGLTYLGPLRLNPAGLTLPAPTLPMLAAGLAISSTQTISLTFPVEIAAGVSPGTSITNTAALACAETSEPLSASVNLTIAPPRIYLPIVLLK